MRSWLKELHRVVQRSCFFLARDQRSLRLLDAEESRRMLSSQITDELKLVAHPVGNSVLLEFLSMCSEKTRERSTSSSGVVDALLERLHTLLRLMAGKSFLQGGWQIVFRTSCRFTCSVWTKQ